MTVDAIVVHEKEEGGKGLIKCREAAKDERFQQQKTIYMA